MTRPNVPSATIKDKNFFFHPFTALKAHESNGGKIFVVRKSKVKHLAKQASGDSLNIELCRNWHWMWSLYYYNFKHFGMFSAYKITLYKFISSLLKSILFMIIDKFYCFSS